MPVEYRDYRPHGSKKRWTEVAIFDAMPRDTPRRSKEGHVSAKFAHPGDAYAYASNLVKVFNDDPCNNYHTAWAVVVR